MKKSILKKIFTFGILALTCVFFIGVSGCKQVLIPNGIITIINECGLAVDIFLGGEYKFYLENDETKSIEDLADGTYELEAHRKGTGEFVSRETLDVIFNRIYTWSVWSSASIKIINKYGETLSIYGDDIYAGEMLDQDESTMDNVPYGDRKLEAKTSDETIVATTTISVLVDLLYEWTINK